MDPHRRELGHEAGERAVDVLAPEPLIEPGERVGQGGGIALLAVPVDHRVQGLVDQAHRVQRARVHRPAGIAHLVHARGQRAGRSHVREQGVPGQGEQRIVAPVPLARGARDVQFEGGKVRHVGGG